MTLIGASTCSDLLEDMISSLNYRIVSMSSITMKVIGSSANYIRTIFQFLCFRLCLNEMFKWLMKFKHTNSNSVCGIFVSEALRYVISKVYTDCVKLKGKRKTSKRSNNYEKNNVQERFMNAPAKRNEAYVPTEIEHVANIVTHGLLVFPSILGLFFLVYQSSNSPEYISAIIYGLGLIGLFSVSTVFHSVFYSGRFRVLKDILHRCDRAVIYLFIAASYTPWLMLKDLEPEAWSSELCWFVWVMAICGIAYQNLFHERYKTLETCFYLIMGIIPAAATLHMQDRSGLTELAAGGLIYILGVVFFKADGRIPCAHAIWHLFVNIGASLHFYAVFQYLIGKHAKSSE